MVKKWRTIASKYFGNEKLDGKLGKNSSHEKKGIVHYLGNYQYICRAINVNYQGLTKSPHEILEIVKVKLTHNLGWI
jgi:hypothetical protein